MSRVATSGPWPDATAVLNFWMNVSQSRSWRSTVIHGYSFWNAAIASGVNGVVSLP